MTAGTDARARRPTVLRRRRHAPAAMCLCVVAPLCVCALLLACTDPRARPAPPTVQIIIPSAYRPASPGRIPASIYAYDPQGLDRLLVSVRSSYAAVEGDSTFFFTEPNEQTMDIVWTVPGGIPTGTHITLVAKVSNVVGFTAADSVVLTVQ